MTLRCLSILVIAGVFLCSGPALLADDLTDTQNLVSELQQKIDGVQASMKGVDPATRKRLGDELRTLNKEKSSTEKKVIQLKNAAKSKAHWAKDSADKTAKAEQAAKEKAEDAAPVEVDVSGSREDLIKRREALIEQMRSVNPAERKTISKKLTAINKVINSTLERVSSLKDSYKGADKEELRKGILDAWKSKYPQDEVLGIAFHMAEFKRDVEAKLNATSIYKTDHSVLAVSVAVKKDDTLAIIFPAYVNRDNLSNSQNIGVDTKGKEYVHKEILVADIKQ